MADSAAPTPVAAAPAAPSSARLPGAAVAAQPPQAVVPDGRRGCAGTPAGTLREGTGLLTIFQAAVAAGVSPATVRRRIREGALPAVKLPGPSGAFLVAARDLSLIRRDPRGMASWRARNEERGTRNEKRGTRNEERG